MPLYKYDSFSRRGAKMSGTIDAGTIQGAKEMLRGQGLMPTSIAEVTEGSAGFTFASLFEKKIDLKIVILFTKQLAVLLRSGVPLLQSFDLLLEQFEGKFRRLLINIRDGIKAGEPLAKELGKYPRVFSNVYVQLVRAGEASGKLETILMRLDEYLERSAETQRRVKKAMSYPIMMLSFAAVIVVGLLTVMVPRLMGMFTSMGKSLPLPTKILVAMSDALRFHLVSVSIGTVALIALFLYWKSTPNGKSTFDKLLLRFPLTAYFSRTKAVVQLSKTLGMLIESGVNLPEALDIVCKILENSVLTEKLMAARDKIIKEGKIARYLKQTGIFPSMASYMINTGEESGKLGEMLLNVGSEYERELVELTDGLTAKIAPIMTLVMAVIIGFIMAAILLPIMDMANMPGI